MIRYQNEKLSIELGGDLTGRMTPEECLDIVLKLIEASGPRPLEPAVHYEVLPPKSASAPTVAEKAVVTKPMTGMDRPMKARIPNVVDLSELTLVMPENSRHFECPNCHQSSFLILKGMNGEQQTIICLDEGTYALDGVQFTTETSTQFDEMLDKETYLDIKDRIVNEKLTFARDSSTLCECPRCHHEEVLEVFIGEYDESSSEYETPCRFCGGEVIQRSVNLEGTITNLAQCDSCHKQNDFRRKLL